MSLRGLGPFFGRVQGRRIIILGVPKNDGLVISLDVLEARHTVNLDNMIEFN